MGHAHPVSAVQSAAMATRTACCRTYQNIPMVFVQRGAGCVASGTADDASHPKPPCPVLLWEVMIWGEHYTGPEQVPRSNQGEGNGSGHCVCQRNPTALNDVAVIKLTLLASAAQRITTLLAQLCPFWGYFGVNFGIIPDHVLVLLPHPLFLWHIFRHFWPFQTLLGHIRCPNSPK